MAYTQDNRLIAIETPLGKDVLLLEAFHGVEGISMPFSFELDLVSLNHNIPFADIVGKNVTISVVLRDETKRFFNGIVSRFSQAKGGGTTEGDPLSYYRATAVPWFWLLGRTADSRIFQNASVLDIVDDLLKEKHKKYGFGNIKMEYKVLTHGTYDKREYCVQYRETDFNFISRLLEEEGIYYFFQHEDGKHTMVIADSPQEHKPVPKQQTADYQATAGAWLDQDVITGLERTQEIRPAKYALNDFNFKIPNTDLKVNVPSKQKLGSGEREIYDYPGLYTKKREGGSRVVIRMEEEEAQITRIDGSSTCRAFTTGYRFTLSHFYRSDMNGKDYVLASIDHEASQPWTKDSEFAYTNRFTCIPFDVPFRPARRTPKPFVQGSQTAIVVGPSGEEIYTDEHGRVKVQFHWDREGKKDEDSSCWIRVSQLWAGEGWGAMWIPRIGHEVIVDFLEGDPDRPIITGRVYHGINKPPYPLPGEKTKSTIKSNSSLGGGGFNEFRFEDKKGQEEIFLHGQKNWTIAILNDKNQTIGHDETMVVGNNRTKTVEVDQSETIGNNKTIMVGVNHTEAIGANESITVGANKTETVVINTAETIGAAKELTIGALYQVSVGAAMNETVGASKTEEIGVVKAVVVGSDMSEQVGGNRTVSVGKDYSETVAKNHSLKAKTVLIEADDQITLKTGSATITMKKSGDITIEGNNINVKGSGNITMKASKILEN